MSALDLPPDPAGASPAETVIALRPGAVPFADVARAAEALGWTRDPDRTAVDAVEPAFASWSRGFDGEMEYTRDGATGLGVVRVRGRDAAASVPALRRALPVLGIGDAAELLQSAEPDALRVGIRAAVEMRALPLLAALLPLRAHADPAVAADAADAAAALLPAAGVAGVAWLREARASRPGKSILFPRMGDAARRRQVVRWMMHDRGEANAHVLEVLRAALEDEDWEVRMSAVLAAVRLGARGLWREVKRAALPETGREGLSAWDRDVLRAARDAALDRLGGAAVPSADAARGEGKAALRAHVARCVAGEPPARLDGIFLLLHALAAPAPPPEPAPSAVPPSLVATEIEGRYRMADTGIELAWVPPVPHWLGDGPAQSAEADPPRAATHPTGFWIAVHPLRDGAAPALLALDAARERLAELSAAGLAFSLPTPDEWEMAARGPDARRYPWGNGAEEGMLDRPSPWGIASATGAAPQWTLADDGAAVLRGGPGDLRCAAPGLLASAESIGAVRPILRP